MIQPSGITRNRHQLQSDKRRGKKKENENYKSDTHNWNKFLHLLKNWWYKMEGELNRQSNAFLRAVGGGLQLTWKSIRVQIKCVNKRYKIIFLSFFVSIRDSSNWIFLFLSNKSFSELKICRMVARIGISWENPIRGFIEKALEHWQKLNKVESLLISKQFFLSRLE